MWSFVIITVLGWGHSAFINLAQTKLRCFHAMMTPREEEENHLFWLIF